MKYLMLFFILFSCTASYKIKYGCKYHLKYGNVRNNEDFYFYMPDSCHIIGFEEDTWSRYYFNSDTLNIVSLYDSNIISNVNCVFVGSNDDSLTVKFFNGKKATSDFWVVLMDSNHNELEFNDYFADRTKYTYPIKYVQVHSKIRKAHSDTLRLNINRGGNLNIFLKYADYSYYPFNFHQKFFVTNNKLKLIK
jgi:hypothetical protein